MTIFAVTMVAVTMVSMVLAMETVPLATRMARASTATSASRACPSPQSQPARG